ncbi:MAG: hypothetical protein GY839_03245 [candidate division Zixibacteria bacterium]|nr:hypothetical protein [candidate division Zixibacteria bacterium]
MRINSNANAHNTMRNLQESKERMKASMEKLSSGLKINRAADDPAGLIISEQMRSQIATIEQEIKNIDMSDNKYSTSEGNLNTLQSDLHEMRNIAMAAANEGGNSEEAQEAYQQSLNDATQGFNNTRDTASYGTQKLLDGSAGSTNDIQPMENLDVSTAQAAQESIEAIDAKLAEISQARGEIGSIQKNDLAARRDNLMTELSNLTAAESTVRDTDMAREFTEFIKSEIQVKAGIAMLAQQKQVPNLVMSFLQE